MMLRAFDSPFDEAGSTTMLCLLEPRYWNNAPSSPAAIGVALALQRRRALPPGPSSFITSAPASDRSRPQNSPGTELASSTTSSPSKAPAVITYVSLRIDHAWVNSLWGYLGTLYESHLQ